MQHKHGDMLPFAPRFERSHLRFHIVGAFQQFGIVKDDTHRATTERFGNLVQHVVHIYHGDRFVKDC